MPETNPQLPSSLRCRHSLPGHSCEKGVSAAAYKTNTSKDLNRYADGHMPRHKKKTTGEAIVETVRFVVRPWSEHAELVVWSHILEAAWYGGVTGGVITILLWLQTTTGPTWQDAARYRLSHLWEHACNNGKLPLVPDLPCGTWSWLPPVVILSTITLLVLPSVCKK